MKILILLDSLKVGGGAERISATLGDELSQRGNNIHYLTFWDKNPKYNFEGQYHTLNCQNSDNNIIKRGYDFWKNSRSIKNMCKELGIETLISVGENANFHAVLSKTLFGNSARIIISQHINPLIHINSKLKVQMINFFYNRADKTVCVSKEIEKLLNNNFNIKNTTTIYNMIDMGEINRLSQESIVETDEKLMNKPAESGFNFINLGSLYQQKGQWYLTRSFRKVIDKYPEARLFILGEGPLKEELENLVKKLDLENNVYLLGNRENVFPYLKNSDCFVFSSLWEGFPMTIMEALCLNLPIISTDCMTGPREAICPELELKEEINYPYYGEYGILTHPFTNELIFKDIEEVPLNSSEEILADLMIEIIEDPKIREKYSKGSRIAQNFHKDKIIKEWETIL